MAYYKLTVENSVNGDYAIGTFKNEVELERWAQENDGELNKSELVEEPDDNKQ